MKTLFFFSGLLLAMNSFAAQVTSVYSRALDGEIERLSRVNLTSSRSGDLYANKSCKQRYKKFYKNRVLKISFGFGYGDTESQKTAFDWFEYHALVNKIKAPCTPDVYLCGFKADRNEKDLYRVAVPSPTGETNYLIELRITRPSLSGNNKYNLAPENIQRQMAACQAATAKFYREVAEGADVVIYSGHSRDGGGPDFCPAKRLANHHVNYDLYRKKKEGITNLTTAMKAAVAAGKPNQVVGLFSCSSQLHFTKALRAASPTTGLLLTNRVINIEGTMDSYAALDSLLAQRCQDGFEQSFGDRHNATSWHNMFN